MKYLFPFFLIFSCYAQQEKTLYKDKAIFRIPGRVVFYSDASLTWNALKKFSCLGNKSLLLKAIGGDKSITKAKTLKYDELIQRGKDLEKVLFIEKIKSFTFRENKLDDHPVLKGIVYRNCPKLKKQSLTDKELISLEIYLRDRFGDGKEGHSKMRVFVQNIFQKTGHEWLLKQ